MNSLDYVSEIVGSIAVFLAGALTFMAVLRRILVPMFYRLGRKLGINDCSVSGLVIAIASGIPPVMMMHDMDKKGIMRNIAFLSSVACTFGDHLAYTARVRPDMCMPLIVCKMVGGFSALIFAVVLAPHLLKNEGREKYTH